MEDAERTTSTAGHRAVPRHQKKKADDEDEAGGNLGTDEQARKGVDKTGRPDQPGRTKSGKRASASGKGSGRHGDDGAEGKTKVGEEEEKEEEEEGDAKTRGSSRNRKANGGGKSVRSGSEDTAKAQQVKDLMNLWLNFQSANKDNYEKIQKLESTLNALENSLDRFGKFCGEYQLIWKVKNFSQSFELARKGERTIIYSPTFDTHRSGYKLQLSLCPNGDGRGFGVSMSLFFAILKGPYDSLLQWPFVCPVTMTLLEQVADVSDKQPCDVTMTFMPNPRPDNAPFLGRPEGPKNLSLGFQKFIPLTDLYQGEYIQDDSLFIKVYVDISSVMAL